MKNEKGKGMEKKKKGNRAKEKEVENEKGKKRGKGKGKRKDKGINTPVKRPLKRKLEEHQTSPPQYSKHFSGPTSPPSEQISHQQLQQSSHQHPYPMPLQQQQSKLQELMEEHDHLQHLIKECRKQDQSKIPQLLSTINALDLQISKELGLILDEEYTIPDDYDISSLEEDDIPPLEDVSE
jgi:uncharacterized protein YdcH (DUF465 family)